MKIIALMLMILSCNSYAKSLQECRSIDSADIRLTCYDQLADKQKGISQSKFGEVKYKEIPTKHTFSVVKAEKVHGKYSITMEDRQVWRQVEKSRTFRIKADDSVTIESGLLSSYFLVKEGSNVKIKVKRIK